LINVKLFGEDIIRATAHTNNGEFVFVRLARPAHKLILEARAA
jgi:hypothetical protein